MRFMEAVYICEVILKNSIKEQYVMKFFKHLSDGMARIWLCRMATTEGNNPFRKERSHQMNNPATIDQVAHGTEAYLTQHAWERMTSRGLSLDAVHAVMDYGRLVYTRGAAICAIGRKEVKHFARQGIDLTQYEGVQVVCSQDGAVMTTYRNRDFRGLRPC